MSLCHLPQRLDKTFLAAEAGLCEAVWTELAHTGRAVHLVLHEDSLKVEKPKRT